MYRSVFEIIGPIMIGPSSSHTAGAVKIGRIARRIFGREPQSIEIHFYGSFARTYKGHATDVAVVGGLLDFDTDNVKIKDSLEIAKAKDINLHFFKEEELPEHPNTVKLVLKDQLDTMSITGISIGGGAVKIVELDGFKLNLSAESPTLLILHRDAYGTVAAVANILAQYKVNISYMEVSRLQKGENAMMIIETDQQIKDDVLSEILNKENVLKVIVLTA